MKYRFSVTEHHFDVEVAPESTFSSPTVMKIQKKISPEVQVAETTRNEATAFFHQGRFTRVEVETGKDGFPTGIRMDGRFFPASLLKMDKLFYYREKEVPSRRSGSVTTFIPGTIKKINIQNGSRVHEGDIVLIHEAMKMENEIRAPRSGVIRQLGVSEGDNVLANHLLFTVEDA